MAKTSKHGHTHAHTSEDAARLPLLVNAARLIGLRLDEFLAYEPFLASPDSVYELHEMRIAAKRLRYTMEIFQDAYTLHTDAGAEFTTCLEAVKAIQEHLGALHDADVLVPRLLEHLDYTLREGYGAHLKGDLEERPIAGVHRVNYDACRGLLNLCTQTRDGRDASYAQLLEAWSAMKAAHQFDRLRALLTGDGEEEKEEKEKEEEKRRGGERENGVTAEGVSGDGMVPALSLSAASSENTPDTPKETSDTSEGTAGITKETDAYDAANRQNAQVRRAPGEPGHVAAARRRANAERSGENGSGARGSGDRNPDGGRPKAEQAGEASEGTADAASQAANGAFAIRDAKRAERAARSKNTRGRDGSDKNARSRPAARRKDASRPA